MTTWTNTCVKNCQRIVTTVEIIDDGSVAFVYHQVADILSCHLTIGKDCEEVLARLLTELLKRNFLNLEKLLDYVHLTKYGPPAIDNINLPCTHNVCVDSVCVNCGMNLIEMKELQS